MKLPIKVGLKANIDDKNYVVSQKITYDGFIQRKFNKGKTEDGEPIEKLGGDYGDFDVWILENEEATIELWEMYKEFWLFRPMAQSYIETYLGQRIEIAKQVLKYENTNQVIPYVNFLHTIFSPVALGNGNFQKIEPENTTIAHDNIRFCEMGSEGVVHHFVMKNLSDESIECFSGQKQTFDNIVNFFESSPEILPIKENLSRLKKARWINLIFIALTFLGWFFGVMLDKKEVYSHTFEVDNFTDTTLTKSSNDFYLPQGNYLLETNINLNVKNAEQRMSGYEIGLDAYVDLMLYEDEPAIHQFEGSGWVASGYDDGYYHEGESYSSDYIYMPKSDTLFADLSVIASGSSNMLETANVKFTIKEAGFIWYNYLFMCCFFLVMAAIIETVIYSYKTL